ncbi:hypothetical protein Tco_0163613 [Tanacetum coccineum]
MPVLQTVEFEAQNASQNVQIIYLKTPNSKVYPVSVTDNATCVLTIVLPSYKTGLDEYELDRIVAKQLLEIVVDELLEKELQLMANIVIVEQLVHHKNVVVQEISSIVEKQRIAVDNIELKMIDKLCVELEWFHCHANGMHIIDELGLSVEERALLFLKAQDRLEELFLGIRRINRSNLLSLYFATSVGIRAEVPVKMPPRKNRPLTEAYEQEFEQRVMARIEERLYQFVDQFADRMNDMMNLRRHGDRNGQRSKGEESENLFFKGDGSSLSAKPEEWEYDGVVDDDYEESPVFDDDQFDDDYERPPVFDDDQFEEELEMLDDAFVLIGKEVAPDSKIPEASLSLQFPNMGESEDLRRQVKDLVSKGYVCERMSPCAQPRRPLDLMSLYVFGSVPEKVHDFVEGCLIMVIHLMMILLEIQGRILSIHGGE